MDEIEEVNRSHLNKKLNRLLGKDRMQDGTRGLGHATNDLGYQSHSILALPTLLQDITNKADKWGTDGRSGRINPFTDIFSVSPLHVLNF